MLLKAFNLPVRSAASAIRKVLYDMRTNRAVSNNGKSLTCVNLVNRAVQHPIRAPIAKDRPKVVANTPRDSYSANNLEPLPVELSLSSPKF